MSREGANATQQYANIQEQVHALSQKYSQKYMGKPESHMEQVFKAPYIADGTHPVPVSNFLNAQCTLRAYPGAPP